MKTEFQIVYHDSDNDIPGNDFDTSIVYFSGRKEFAKEFGEIVKEYKVVIKNPYCFDEQPDQCYHDKNGNMILDEDGCGISIGFLGAHLEIVEELIARGYDGAVDEDEFVVTFNNEQIIPLSMKKYSEMDNTEIRRITFDKCPSKCVNCERKCGFKPVIKCREHLSKLDN